MRRNGNRSRRWSPAPQFFRLAASMYRLLGLRRPRLLMLEATRDAYLVRLGDEPEPEILDRILAVSRELVAVTPASSRRRGRYLRWLAESLLLRYDSTSVEATRDMDEAVQAARDALRATPEGPKRLRPTATLAACLIARAELPGGDHTLREAVDLLVPTFESPDGDDDGLRNRTELLCLALRWCVIWGRWDIDLAGGVRAVRRAVARMPSPMEEDALAELGGALCEAVTTGPGRVLLAESIALARVAVAHPAPSDQTWQLQNLAGLLFTKANLDGEAAEIAESVQLRREVLDMTPVDHPELLERMSTLVHALRTHYQMTGDSEVLHEAAATHHRALELAADMPDHLAGLSDVLRLRYAREGDRADMVEAVEAARRALAATAADDPARPSRLNQLGLALWTCFDDGGDPSVLDEAIDLCRQAEQICAEDDTDRATYLTNISALLATRHAMAESAQDARDAVAAGRHAVAIAIDGSRPLALSAYARALMALYRSTGNADALDEAVEVSRETITATPAGGANRARYDYELSDHLLTQFIRSGNPADLRESIDLARRAIEGTPPGAPAARSYALGLGSSLLTRSVADEDDSALGEAIEVLRQASATAPPDDPDLALYLATLGGCLWQWFHRTGDASVLDEGIEAARRAIDLGLDQAMRRAHGRMNLALLLWARFQSTGDPDDLDEAVTTSEQACADIPEGRPYRALSWQNYGEVLAARFDHNGDPNDRYAAVAALRRAIAAGPGEVRTRIDAGGRLAELAAGSLDWAMTTESLGAAVRLLPQLAPRHFRRPDQERALTSFPGLASDAAAAALHLGKPELAAELLEQGRGILLSQTLDVRDDLTDLSERSPELAERLDRLRHVLDTTDDPPAMPRPEPSPGQEWDRLVAEIRRLPGLERFLMPPSAAELTAVADDGPVVVVNTGRYRSDALVITTAGIDCVPLPGLTPKAAAERVTAFGHAIEAAHDEHARLDRRLRAEGEVRDTLGWLWDTIAEPVLDALGIHGPPDNGPPPRLWWIPTGPLGFLPLHAAGHYPHPGEAPTESILDRVTCSYAPTLRALLRAREAPDDQANDRPLVVAVPHAAEHRPLHDVRAEAEAAAGRLPAARVLLDGDATRDRVLAALASSGWVHFACHGHSDPADPSASHLMLHDGPLSVLDVGRLRIRHGRFALLSACGTARGAISLADESIHLTTAFHLAGYRHVVGTMWPVADDVAHQITTHVYAAAGHQAEGSATALHTAIQQARQRWPHTPSIWASWIHVGA